MSALTSKPRWCAAHDDYVALYDDGSFSCRYGLVVESSVEDECRVVEFPLMSVLRRLLEAAETMCDTWWKREPDVTRKELETKAALRESVVEARQTIGEGT